MRRSAVRTRKKNGQWGVGVLISTLAPRDVILLTRQPIDRADDSTAVLLAYVSCYDQRGGGVETSFKAAPLVTALRTLLAPAHVAVTLGQT